MAKRLAIWGTRTRACDHLDEVSEMADLSSIHGFRVAPLVKIVLLPIQP